MPTLIVVERRVVPVKLLIAAEGVQRAMQLPVAVRLLIEAASEIWVMSPSVVGPIQWLTGGVDEARQSADQRVEVIVDQLAAKGITATGKRGDELGREAFDDALRQFPADHVIVAMRQSDRPWQRGAAMEHLFDRRGLSVTMFTVQP